MYRLPNHEQLCSISPECMYKFGIILQVAVISIRKINLFVFDDGQGVNSQQCCTCVYFWLQRDKFAAVAFYVNLRLLHNILYIQNRLLRKYNSFIHSVFCLTTGTKPPPKRFLHTVPSRASFFK